MSTNYRPITDVMILARCRYADGKPRYGGYLGGFPERARTLIGISLAEPMLHACGGKAKLYPYERGLGPHDKTLDIDPDVTPDFLQDAREPWPLYPCSMHWQQDCGCRQLWKGILIDPPYSEEDAKNYVAGAAAYPSPSLLLKRAFEVLEPGGKVGIIHYFIPKPPKDAIFTAMTGVMCGFNNKLRAFSVFEKPLIREPKPKQKELK